MADYLGQDYGWIEDATDARLGLAPSEERAYLECMARRLLTPYGSIPYWPDYGCNVRQYLLSSTPTHIIASAVEAEMYKDERTNWAQAVVTQDDTTLTLTVSLETDTGNFAFTMTVTEAAANLVTLQRAA